MLDRSALRHRGGCEGLSPPHPLMLRRGDEPLILRESSHRELMYETLRLAAMGIQGRFQAVQLRYKTNHALLLPLKMLSARF